MMKSATRREFLTAGVVGATVTGLGIPILSEEAMAYQYQPPASLPYSPAREEVNAILAKPFEGRIVKVRDGVYSAMGYALGNMIMIETNDGLVIVDTTESIKVAEKIMAEFRKISDKPIKYIIYTHSHGDHYRGTKAFYKPEMKVVAHELFMPELKLQNIRGLRGRMGAVAMFALQFPPNERHASVGIYPEPRWTRLNWEMIAPKDLIFPNVTFNEKHVFKLGGLSFECIHTPGETPDQIIVHIPEYKLVICGDNFYASFPNLYTIRGTSYRPVAEWAEAQDTVINLAPEILVPMHGFPIKDAAEIKNVLGNYRDAINHVHNLAYSAVKKNMTIDQFLPQAKLPPELSKQPYLQEYYGNVKYCAQAIYESLVGWFDGDPVNLNPLTRKELGAEILALAGSADNILAQADKAQKAGRHQAVLELCEMVLQNTPENETARRMKIVSLQALSNLSINGPTINWYKSFALFETDMMEE
ncbi:MAG: alkyl/aryl-sulfatase [Deltaproteobacteria bacterium]|nr:alkyl/aryl-sulfatase [Deltaproteobacteria bacterium]